MIVTIAVYVCPTEGCGNYFGASGMGDMESQQTDVHLQQETFPRKRCPDCMLRGNEVNRKLVVTKINVEP